MGKLLGDDNEREQNVAFNFSKILLDDILVAADRLAETNNQMHKRELVRAIFAGIEGNIWTYKEKIRKLAADIEAVDSLTLLAMDQKQYYISDNGGYSVKDTHISTKIMFRFACKVAEKINPDLSIDFGNGGWEKLNKAYDVRDRITHPKTIQDLTISIQDIATVWSATIWLTAAIGYSLELSYQYAEELTVIAQKLVDGDSEFLALYELAKQAN